VSKSISQHTRLLIPKIEFKNYDLISTNHTINFRRPHNGSSSPFLWEYATSYSISNDTYQILSEK